MKNIQRFAISLSVLTMFSGLAIAVPASARDGSSSDDTVTTTATTQDNQTETETSASGHELADQFKQEATTKLEKDQTQHHNHTEAERQKACTARQANLKRRMTNAVSQANRHKAVFDKIYNRVKDFYTTKQLSVTGYSDLTAKVDAAQTAAQTSIDALSSLDVNVDCTSQTVAASIGAFQTAVKSTRDSLKAYRSAITDLITAVKGASTSTTDNTESQ